MVYLHKERQAKFQGGCSGALVTDGSSARHSGAERLCFPVNSNKWNLFLKETVYSSVHNDINPSFPSDLREYHWVRGENGQMTGLSKVTLVTIQLESGALYPSALKGHLPFKEKNCYQETSSQYNTVHLWPYFPFESFFHSCCFSTGGNTSISENMLVLV